jgi:glucose/arabinose dehydrogenase
VANIAPLIRARGLLFYNMTVKEGSKNSNKLQSQFCIGPATSDHGTRFPRARVLTYPRGVSVAAKRKKLALVAAVLALIVVTQSCGGGSDDSGNPPPPPGPVTATLTSIASGFVDPLGFVQPNDGTGRFFILEQRGTIRIIQNGSLVAAPFLDIQALVEDGGELGLLGLAFHPQFAQNRRFYLNYTTTQLTGGLQSVIAEYQALAADPNRADANSERILITVNQPFTNHNGGQLAFGPDGFLYIALGDGGDRGDPLNNGQRLNTLLGKILRIDVNGNNSANGQYGIPANNPFVADTSAQPEIWAFGLRNPWRFSFDTVSGRLFCGDVGQNAFEEIDIIVPGGNYGWRIMEGAHCFNSSGCNQTGLILPIAEYGRNDGEAVIGGFVYRGTAIPALQGAYVFGDFSFGTIWMLRETSSGTWTRTQLLDTTRNISAFGQDQAGEVYVLDYANGIVFRLSP